LTVEFFFSTYILCSCVTLFSLLSIGFPSHTDASVHFCPYKDRLAASTIKSSFLHEFCPFYSIIDAFLRTVKFQLFVLVERCRLLFWKKIVIVFLIKFFLSKSKNLVHVHNLFHFMKVKLFFFKQLLIHHRVGRRVFCLWVFWIFVKFSLVKTPFPYLYISFFIFTKTHLFN
jgi:hypothetical protein